jgi:hypothetical protein
LSYVVGVAGILVFWRGLAQIIPTEPLVVEIVLRYILNSLVVFWALCGAPWMFLSLRLAERT